MLVELSALLKPRLSIMDAIVGMEGNGPGSGDPRRIGAVLVGQDPVAVDVVAADLVGCAPEHLPVIRAAIETRIGETCLDRVQLIGDALDKLRLRDFRLPPREHTEWRLPEWLKRTLKDALTTRPVIDHRSCIRCDICRNDCPQQAISEQGERLIIDHRNCIRCFCCQEFCPRGAITVAKGWVLRFARK
jgi:ferredoxin